MCVCVVCVCARVRAGMSMRVYIRASMCMHACTFCVPARVCPSVCLCVVSKSRRKASASGRAPSAWSECPRRPAPGVASRSRARQSAPSCTRPSEECRASQGHGDLCLEAATLRAARSIFAPPPPSPLCLRGFFISSCSSSSYGFFPSFLYLHHYFFLVCISVS